MRYRVYDDARYANGAVAAGRTLTVYNDAAMTTKATLYTAITGTSTVANPLTIPSTGIVDFWVADRDVWGLSQGDSVARPLQIIDAPPEIVNVKDFGAAGDGTTDDTAAFVSAVSYADALEGVWPLYEKPSIHLPAGRYALTNVPLAAARNIRITGDGKNTTVLVAKDTDGILFDLGTFDGTPTSWYEGASQGFTLENLSVIEPTNAVGKPPGRTATAIRDCGCGNVTLRNVEVRGFQYGFSGAYGSDFTVIEDCLFNHNDVAVEFGPHTNQFEMSRTHFGGNGVGVLLEWQIGGALRDCYFIDSHEYDVKFDYSSPTVAGVTHADSYYTGATLLDHCWFESGAGYYGAGALADSAGHIYIGGSTSTPSGVTIRDPFIYAKTTTTDDMMAAEDPATVYGFVRLAAGKNVVIEHARHYGTRLDAIVAPLDGYTGGTAIVRDWVNHAAATTPPAVCSPWIAGVVYESESGRNRTTTDAQMYQKMSSSDGDSFFRLRWEPSSGKLLFGSSADDSTWLEYFGVNPAGKLFFGYQPSASVMSFGTAAPIAGAHLRGEIVFNSGAAAGGTIGWVCTTAGKAHAACTGDTHSNTTLDNVNPTTAFADGDVIKGSGIPAGTTVASGGGTATITLSQAATATASGVALYDAVFKTFGVIAS